MGRGAETIHGLTRVKVTMMEGRMLTAFGERRFHFTASYTKSPSTIVFRALISAISPSGEVK
jgi:hypothetical protein